MKFTHIGWFGFCPIKIADLDSEVPLLAPRWAILAPVFWLAEQMEAAAIAHATLYGREPQWGFKVTGEITSNDKGNLQ